MQCSSGSRLGGGAAATAPLWLRHWYTDHMTLLLKSAATTWSQKLLKNIRCWTASASTLHTSALAQIRWLGLRVNSRTNKVRTTATPKYLSELVQTHASSRALRSFNSPLLVVPRSHELIHRTGPSRFFCGCSIHLELSTCWHSTVRKHSHFQTPLENPYVQTHLVILCCIKRLCIFGPEGAIHICYYYYYTGTWRTNGETDGQNCYNRARVSMLTRDKNVWHQRYPQ